MTVPLPEVLPIFPLAGALLLPRGKLPLHVFEPRYRNMTRDALAGDGVIGMVQPRDADTDEPRPEVFATGCAGRIDDCSQTDDGRYYFTLTGLNRFHITAELPLGDGYRRVLADYAPFADDSAAPGADRIDRAALLRALGRYLEAREIAADWEAVDTCSDERLVTTLAMSCPFAPSEKQALLESADLTRRAEFMTALMDMGALEGAESQALRH